MNLNRKQSLRFCRQRQAKASPPPATAFTRVAWWSVALLLASFSALSLEAGDELDGWLFSNTNWLSWSGYPPLAFTNLLNVQGGDGNCLELNSTNPAFLRYNVVEDDATVELSTPFHKFAHVFSRRQSCHRLRWHMESANEFV